MPLVVCAPDSFKGVLSALQAADHLARGAEQVPGVSAARVPIADGGEGTAEVVQTVLGGRWVSAPVVDPFDRPVAARLLLLPDGRAVVECAEAIGLPLLRPDERDPLRASSRGFGELLLAARGAGATGAIVGLGGSATVDGGAGMLEALGGRLPLPVTVACDVSNPLLGPRGAARAFGPQKGAGPAAVEELERRLAARADLRPFRNVPGAGAAGGLGAALASIGAQLLPGADLILDLLRIDDVIAEAALVITGEGRVDRTTGEGKGPGTLARRCADRGVRCVVCAGVVCDAPPDLEVVSLSGDRARVAGDLTGLGLRLARELVIAAETTG